MKIDPFYLLMLIELVVVLFAFTAFLFFRNRKHKNLYQKTLRQLNDLKSNEPERTSDSSARTAPSGDDLTDGLVEGLNEALADAPAEIVPEGQPDQQPLTDSVFTESVDGDEDEPDRLKRLQRMVNFQKRAIIELMCYKDIFESAKSRLGALNESNYELEERVKKMLEGGMEGVGITEVTDALENNNHELEKFISILDRENSSLSGKFSMWEEKFRHIAEDAIESPAPQAAGDASCDGVMQEKEELLIKVKGIEDQLEERNKSLEAMQAQYEDLEKEYMILYRQQQAQQQLEQQQLEQQQQEQPKS